MEGLAALFAGLAILIAVGAMWTVGEAIKKAEQQNKTGGVLGRQLEPVAGMTDAETEQTAALLRDIARTHSVVVVEHDMHFVRELGVKVTCLHEGRVLAEGSLDHVSADPRVVEVYLGR